MRETDPMTETMTDETTDGMQPGDEVILCEGSWTANTVRRVARIVRRTKTQVVVNAAGKERRFLASGFRAEVGSSSSSQGASIAPATRDELAAVRVEQKRRALLARIGAVKLDTLPTEKLEAVAALLAE